MVARDKQRWLLQFDDQVPTLEVMGYNDIRTLIRPFALVFVVVNLVVDLSYALIDPRIRYGKGEG